MSHIRHIQRNMARTALAAEGVTKVNRRLSADKYIKGWTKTWRQAADDCVLTKKSAWPTPPRKTTKPWKKPATPWPRR